MPEFALAERLPLAHAIVAGRHGRADGQPGVTLSVRAGLTLHMLIARKGRADELRQAAKSCGLESWPGPGRFTAEAGFLVLWAGPDQWLIAADPEHHAAADRLVMAAAATCAVVEQTDARAVVAVSGSAARATLAKGVLVDLHARTFGPGTTALTLAANIAVQIWQIDEAPTFLIAVPRSFAEDFWRWLTHAAAEFGAVVA